MTAQTELMETAAHRAINSSLTKTVNLAGRLGSQLKQQIDVYAKLAARELTPSEPAVPDDITDGDDSAEGASR